MMAIKELRQGEDGYTITEMMVVLLILSILLGTFYAFLFGGDRAAKDGRDWLELNQTARLAFERLTREMREAEIIHEVIGNGSGEKGAWGIKFSADFNATGSFVTGTYVPLYENDETITYRYDPAAGQLLISTLETPTETALADHISSFRLSYFGSDPRADVGCSPQFPGPPSGCAEKDGVVMWQELDRTFWAGIAGFGNGNNDIDVVEFPHISSILVEMTVTLRHEEHSYRTGVELRNLFR